MPFGTSEELKQIFRDRADEARALENRISSLKLTGAAVKVFKERLCRIDEQTAATGQTISAVLEAVTRAEKKRDEQAAVASAIRQKQKTSKDLKENVPDNAEELAEKIEELEAAKLFAAEEQSKIKALRSIMSLYAHIAPISWYQECSEERAWGVLGEPGHLQEIDITGSQFDIVNELWGKLE